MEARQLSTQRRLRRPETPGSQEDLRGVFRLLVAEGALVFLQLPVVTLEVPGGAEGRVHFVGGVEGGEVDLEGKRMLGL